MTFGTVTDRCRRRRQCRTPSSRRHRRRTSGARPGRGDELSGAIPSDVVRSLEKLEIPSISSESRGSACQCQATGDGPRGRHLGSVRAETRNNPGRRGRTSFRQTTSAGGDEAATGRRTSSPRGPNVRGVVDPELRSWAGSLEAFWTANRMRLLNRMRPSLGRGSDTRCGRSRGPGYRSTPGSRSGLGKPVATVTIAETSGPMPVPSEAALGSRESPARRPYRPLSEASRRRRGGGTDGRGDGSGRDAVRSVTAAGQGPRGASKRSRRSPNRPRCPSARTRMALSKWSVVAACDGKPHG